MRRVMPMDPCPTGEQVRPFKVLLIGHAIPFVYFDQQLGAAHSKGWSKYAFLMFFCMKNPLTRVWIQAQEHIILHILCSLFYIFL